MTGPSPTGLKRDLGALADLVAQMERRLRAVEADVEELLAEPRRCEEHGLELVEVSHPQTGLPVWVCARCSFRTSWALLQQVSALQAGSRCG